jgi:cation diffusion facilitator CzcD-associated flavoprotein CzcO
MSDSQPEQDESAASGPAAAPGSTELDVLVVGAGFSGIYMLHKLRQLGLTARVVERGVGVGGVWFWNRYPGARCDVQSFDYCYSFDEDLQQEWRWTERYAAQPEILRYIEHVVERFDLRRDIQFETTVVGADFDEQTDRWHVRTEAGPVFDARFVVMATGVLSATKRPDVPGLEDFEGDWYLTADWPREGVDLTGRRVGLIGTGSTGIQIAPMLAEQAEHLYVFQRTPNFSLPARNHPLDDDFYRELRAGYRQRRIEGKQSARGYPSPPVLADRPALEHSAEERQAVYERVWANGGPTFTSSFPDLTLDKAANDTAADFVRAKIRETVHDPVTAELLSPYDHPLGTRRPCVDTDYYATFNRDNVTLVDVRSAAIERIEPHGLRTTTDSYELDTIVFAIGFDAMTGALLRIDITGAGGLPLRKAWEDGPHTYLGVAVAGFPNLFMVTGPGSPSVLTNMVMSIEQHVEWISELIRHACEHGAERIEAQLDAQEAWSRHVVEAADRTLLPLANSWWAGSNIPGKPRVFMPYVAGFAAYGEKLRAVADRGYDGFDLTSG